MMDKKEIMDLVTRIGKRPIEIEKTLGMPQGTLLKAIAKTRELPEKWEMPLRILANPSSKDPEGEKKICQETRLVVKKGALTHIDTPSGKRFVLDSRFDAPANLYVADEFGQMGKITDLPPNIEFRPNNNELRFVRPKPWIKEIESFCKEYNCTPQDLMDNYKAELKKPETNWMSDLIN